MQQLIARIERHKAGESVGIFSVCSAHPWVIRAALAQAVRRGEPVLIEATSNQVNQFGGYTGMTPAQFRDAVWHQANECGLPRYRVWLGGDHLGPNAWQDRPVAEAMALTETLIDDYVAVGFRKIHLDCSMRCQDDSAQLDYGQLSQRAARLCAVVERCWRLDGGEPPVCIIGTEVPVPGGAHEALDGLAMTTPQAVEQTLSTHRQAWRAAGLEAVWPRVIELVVQPGVEFDHQSVERYRPERDAALSRFIEQWPHMVYEAHSTDYQSPQMYQELVRDHFDILKVGPAHCVKRYLRWTALSGNGKASIARPTFAPPWSR
ncbi:putative tagatose 6-phosphate kinase [Sodalis glossinidius str. 'morsitans']|uniref:Tagatose 6-phosphate kinase n=1 Tax=Sodalis glossinidius (strain morsitans) TaxID=343509 RepID=Q2NWM3_SODGM|nr:putative tagatose 6-phosphate kinase [Sodalis glossinidius str. 'morsitans']